MYAYLKGTLVRSHPTESVLDVGGIGYLVYTPVNVYPKLPHTGVQIQLFTSFVVRELSHSLYGFLTEQERDAFEALMGVTGIGPKLALSLIGHLPLADLQSAVNQGNAILLCRVPGVGKKTAERLCIELRDKLNHLLPSNTDGTILGLADPRSQQIGDAMSALISLGYNQLVAQKAIKKALTELPDTIHLAELITHALKHI